MRSKKTLQMKKIAGRDFNFRYGIRDAGVRGKVLQRTSRDMGADL